MPKIAFNVAGLNRVTSLGANDCPSRRTKPEKHGRWNITKALHHFDDASYQGNRTNDAMEEPIAIRNGDFNRYTKLGTRAYPPPRPLTKGTAKETQAARAANLSGR